MVRTPTIKFTLDGYVFERLGGDTNQPWILQDPYPALPSLTSGDLDFSGKLGARVELFFYAQPGHFAS